MTSAAAPRLLLPSQPQALCSSCCAQHRSGLQLQAHLLMQTPQTCSVWVWSIAGGFLQPSGSLKLPALPQPLLLCTMDSNTTNGDVLLYWNLGSVAYPSCPAKTQQQADRWSLPLSVDMNCQPNLSTQPGQCSARISHISHCTASPWEAKHQMIWTELWVWNYLMFIILQDAHKKQRTSLKIDLETAGHQYTYIYT